MGSGLRCRCRVERGQACGAGADSAPCLRSVSANRRRKAPATATTSRPCIDSPACTSACDSKENRLGPVDSSFRALYGRLKFTVRRHTFNEDPLSYTAPRKRQVIHPWQEAGPLNQFGDEVDLDQ